MEENVVTEVVVEPDITEYRRILNDRKKKTIRDNKTVLIFELCVIVFIALVTFAIGGFAQTGLRIALLISIAVFLVNLLTFGMLKRDIHSQAKKWAGNGDSIKYTFTPDGLKSSSKMLTWESPWVRFNNIIETDSDFLFYVERESFVPIPKRFIPDDIVLGRLRHLISSNAKCSVELLS